MKSERRHELQNNELANQLGAGITALRPALPMVIGGVVLAGLAFAGYSLFSGMSNKKSADAWTEYYFKLTGADAESYEALAEDFSGSSAGDWARHAAGSQYLSDGVEAIYRNRAEGEELLNKAIEELEPLTSSSIGHLRTKALFGLAQAYESLGELDKAIENYEAISDSDASDEMKKRAVAQVEFLKSDSGKQFYAWFDKLDPKPDAPIQLPSDLAVPPTSPGGIQFDPVGGTGIDPSNLPPLPSDDAQTPDPEPAAPDVAPSEATGVVEPNAEPPVDAPLELDLPAAEPATEKSE